MSDCIYSTLKKCNALSVQIYSALHFLSVYIDLLFYF